MGSGGSSGPRARRGRSRACGRSGGRSAAGSGSSRAGGGGSGGGSGCARSSGRCGSGGWASWDDAEPLEDVLATDLDVMAGTEGRIGDILGSVSIDHLGVILDWSVGVVSGKGDAKNVRPLLVGLNNVLISESIVQSSVPDLELWSWTGVSWVGVANIISPIPKHNQQS